jgi:predicted transcriptional regulator
MAERIGMSQALASWHVKRLVASGVLLTTREGRSNALRVAAHVPMPVDAGAPVAVAA